ncbi:hypothetical protein ABBQ38_002635 [Trebouxia sp. C0009 RCD-2024]
MSSFVALLRSRASLRAACSKSTSVKLQLALQKWQLSSGCRAFSARASDEDGDGEKTPVSHRGSWRTWVDEQLSGIDQAALKEQQQLAARQLQQQQQAQEPATSPEAQQSALADAHEEVLGYGDEDHVAAIPGLETSSEASLSGKDEAMLADTANIAELDQPVSQLAAADPAEASSQPDPEPIVATPEPSWISGAAELSVDERIDVFLTAIRNRSWEETGRQPVVWAEGAMPKLEMPPSGYSEIAGTSAIKGQMLNPGRSFYPGQAYEPEDLLAAEQTRRFNPKREITTKAVVRGNKEVLASADFRNLEFLNEFVTDGGQIVPRTKTKLQAKVHRHLARQIKTARVMALLPVSDLLDSDFDRDGTVNDSLPGYRRLMDRE